MIGKKCSPTVGNLFSPLNVLHRRFVPFLPRTAALNQADNGKSSNQHTESDAKMHRLSGIMQQTKIVTWFAMPRVRVGDRGTGESRETGSEHRKASNHFACACGRGLAVHLEIASVYAWQVNGPRLVEMQSVCQFKVSGWHCEIPNRPVIACKWGLILVTMRSQPQLTPEHPSRGSIHVHR